MRIPLPPIHKGADAKAHPFPFQICFQTLEFLQGSILYVSFSDCATGEFIKLPGSMEKIEKLFVETLYSQESYDKAWEYLSKYQEIFQKSVFSNVLVSFCSHWDWYLRQLATFVTFSRKHITSPNLSKNEAKEFARIGHLPFLSQVELIQKSAGCTLELSQITKEQLQEMTLVRNLGLHNRWEVDEKYLLFSNREGLDVGDLRLVEVEELHRWHAALVRLILDLSSAVAIRYVNAPDFPEVVSVIR